MLLFLFLIPLVIWLLPFTKLKGNKVTRQWVINNIITMLACMVILSLLYTWWGMSGKGIIAINVLIIAIWGTYMRYKSKNLEN